MLVHHYRDAYSSDLSARLLSAECSAIACVTCFNLLPFNFLWFLVFLPKILFLFIDLYILLLLLLHKLALSVSHSLVVWKNIIKKPLTASSFIFSTTSSGADFQCTTQLCVPMYAWVSVCRALATVKQLAAGLFSLLNVFYEEI